MPKFCSNCGAELKEGYKFCLSCGKEIKVKFFKPINQTRPNQPQQTQSSVQQSYVPITSKKTNTKLLLGIIIAIIAIIIIAVVIIFVAGDGVGTGPESNFVGTWETSINGYSTFEWIFNSDKTLEYGFGGITAKVGTWDVVNNKLRLLITDTDSGLTSHDYEYEFSNGRNTLDLKINGITIFTMTKV